MLWRGRRGSDNIEDRRGMGGGGRVALGGGGAIVILLVAMLFGADPRALLEQLGNQTSLQTPSSQVPGKGVDDDMKQFVSVILAETEDVWNGHFQSMGRPYQEPRLVLFTGQVESAWGFASAAVGPFYCPGDAQVYLDLEFFQQLDQRLGAPGDFAQAYVIAHEVGHHVQNLLGISNRVRELQQGVSREEANRLSVRLELQADFFAGVWAHHANRTSGVLEPGDIEEGLRAASAIGDDRLIRAGATRSRRAQSSSGVVRLAIDSRLQYSYSFSCTDSRSPWPSGVGAGTRRWVMSVQVSSTPLQIGSTAPDFEADTTEGRIKFHDWVGDSWAVLFSHPKDFTPVCTTELGYMAKLKPEFDKRNTKVIGLSVDPVSNHAKWAVDIKETQGHAPNYPMIGDPELAVSKLYGMLPGDLVGSCEGRTPADNQTVRNVYVIGPDKKIKLMIAYPMTTGRNFDEVLRVIDSIQLTAKHKVATPVNWKQGEDVIIAGSVSDDDAKKTYPDGWKAPKPYLRIVPQPKG